MVIALTGGIASGKSTVSQWFIEKGIPVIDCDALVHSSYNEGGLMYQAVVDTFGPRILTAQGEIDRKLLGEIVFRDPAALKQLSNITHPIVRSMVDQNVKELQALGQELIVVDIPLLYESGMENHYEQVMVVYITPELQLERLMRRNGFSETEAKRRIASQMRLEDKAKLADYVINNDEDLDQLYQQLEALLKRLLKA